MKAVLCLILTLVTLRAAVINNPHSGSDKKKEAKANKPKTPVIKNIPEDIKESEQFLKQSAKDYDTLQKESAIRMLKMNQENMNLDLEIPHLETPLEDPSLKPVAKLDNAENKNSSNDRQLNGKRF